MYGKKIEFSVLESISSLLGNLRNKSEGKQNQDNQRFPAAKNPGTAERTRGP